ARPLARFSLFADDGNLRISNASCLVVFARTSSGRLRNVLIWSAIAFSLGGIAGFAVWDLTRPLEQETRTATRTRSELPNVNFEIIWRDLITIFSISQRRGYTGVTREMIEYKC